MQSFMDANEPTCQAHANNRFLSPMHKWWLQTVKNIGIFSNYNSVIDKSGPDKQKGQKQKVWKSAVKNLRCDWPEAADRRTHMKMLMQTSMKLSICSIRTSVREMMNWFTQAIAC